MPDPRFLSRTLPAAIAAFAAVAVGGASLGEMVGSSPMIQHHVAEADDGSIDSLFATAEGGHGPDHYPIVTPQGRFSVDELSERGLYSQARFGGYSVGQADPFGDEGLAQDLAYWDEQALPEPSRMSDNLPRIHRGSEVALLDSIAEGEPQISPMPVLVLAQ